MITMMVTMMMMMATMITMNDADDVDDDDDETGFQCSGHLRTQAQWGEDPGCCLSIYSGSFLPSDSSYSSSSWSSESSK